MGDYLDSFIDKDYVYESEDDNEDKCLQKASDFKINVENISDQKPASS